MTRGIPREFTPTEEAALAAAFQSEARMLDIQRQFGIHKNTLYDLRNQFLLRGLTTRRGNRKVAEIEREVRRLCYAAECHADRHGETKFCAAHQPRRHVAAMIDPALLVRRRA